MISVVIHLCVDIKQRCGQNDVYVHTICIFDINEVNFHLIVASSKINDLNLSFKLFKTSVKDCLCVAMMNFKDDEKYGPKLTQAVRWNHVKLIISPRQKTTNFRNHKTVDVWILN